MNTAEMFPCCQNLLTNVDQQTHPLSLHASPMPLSRPRARVLYRIVATKASEL